MRLLAASKMVVDAMKGFREAVDELDRQEVPADTRQKVLGWYNNDYMPMVRRVLNKDVPVDDFLPVGAAPYFLQKLYIVDNPHPAARRKLMDDAGDGSTYSKIHATYHPLMRTAAATLRLLRLPDGAIRAGRPGRSTASTRRQTSLTSLRGRSLSATPTSRSAASRCAGCA